jgi:hypothetical protein
METNIVKCYDCDVVIKEGKGVKYKTYTFCSETCMRYFKQWEHIDVEKLGKEMDSLMFDSQVTKKKKRMFI